MSLYEGLRTILEQSELTFEEVRAFGTGFLMLTDKEQKLLADILKEDPELIYPLYINFKAKLRAARGSHDEWVEAVETEIVQLEDFLSKRKVGDEIM